MKRQFLYILFCMILCLQMLQSQGTVALTNEQKSWLAHANRHEKNGWVYLHIEGTPKERGFQHGYLLARDIKEAIRTLSEEWKYETAMEWSWFIQKAGEILTAKVDSENLAEIEGMVDGMKTAGVSATSGPR